MTAKRVEPALEILRNGSPRQPGPIEPGARNDAISAVREWLDVIADGRWVVAAAVVVAVLVAIAYVLTASPVYRTDALVQVEEKKGASTFLGELSGALSENSPAETEIEVLRSRAMLGAVVRELGLEVVAQPVRFPVIGAAVARRHRDPAVAGAFMSRAYAWGGERIRVDRLEVPERLLGKRLTLVTGEGTRFTLTGPEGERLLEGEVGTPASGGDVGLFVSELRSRPGVEFAVMRRRHDEVVESLQKRVKIAEKSKKTGMLQLSLEGGSPREIAAIVDSLAAAYVRQNVERRSADAQKTLDFLQTQLPTLRADLDAAEAELESYRSKHGRVDVTLETQAAVSRAVEVERALAELRVNQAALRERFTEQHPAYVAGLLKAKRLEAERATIDGRLRKLPQAELESVRRMRNVKVANELYLTVMNKAQELRVVKEGTIGNVRILDSAIVPVAPVAPKATQTVAIALVFGLLAGVMGAFARRALADGVEDPEEVERGTSIPVSACVPHSDSQQDSDRQGGADARSRPLLAMSDPKDLAVESLRSLRTSLQFALAESRNQIVAIGGPAPGVGKSFVTANLAHLLGDAGKRVLVIDADLRRGQLHRHFGLDRGAGLADAIAGECTTLEAIRPTRSPNVSALTTGRIPSNPAELLGSDRFQRLLGEVAALYDIVLVDTPPVLAVTDAALVARSAGVTFLVIRAGKHPLREILASLRQLGRNGVRVQGIVVNDVRLERGLGRRNAYHYQYSYD